MYMLSIGKGWALTECNNGQGSFHVSWIEQALGESPNIFGWALKWRGVGVGRWGSRSIGKSVLVNKNLKEKI